MGGGGYPPPMYACPPQKNFLKNLSPALSPPGSKENEGVGSPPVKKLSPPERGGDNFFKWEEFKFHLLCCKVIRQFLECLFSVVLSSAI